jgi:hypothetical protein
MSPFYTSEYPAKNHYRTVKQFHDPSTLASSWKQIPAQNHYKGHVQSHILSTNSSSSNLISNSSSVPSVNLAATEDHVLLMSDGAAITQSHEPPAVASDIESINSIEQCTPISLDQAGSAKNLSPGILNKSPVVMDCEASQQTKDTSPPSTATPRPHSAKPIDDTEPLVTATDSTDQEPAITNCPGDSMPGIEPSGHEPALGSGQQNLEVVGMKRIEKQGNLNSMILDKQIPLLDIPTSPPPSLPVTSLLPQDAKSSASLQEPHIKEECPEQGKHTLYCLGNYN